MKDRVVVVLAMRQLGKVLARLRCMIPVQLEHNRTHTEEKNSSLRQLELDKVEHLVSICTNGGRQALLSTTKFAD